MSVREEDGKIGNKLKDVYFLEFCSSYSMQEDMPGTATRSITEHTVVVAVEDQVSSELGDEKVILSLEEGEYYGLNEVGARIWELIQEPTAIKDVRDQLLNEYDVDAQQCERDVLALVADLVKEDLIEIR